MNASLIYAMETGRESHAKSKENGELPCAAYVEWMERIVERVAVMMNVVEGDRSVYNHDDLEDLCSLFKQRV